MANPLRETIQQEKPMRLEGDRVILRGKDHKEHRIVDSVAPIQNKQGDTTGAVMVFREQFSQT